MGSERLHIVYSVMRTRWTENIKYVTASRISELFGLFSIYSTSLALLKPQLSPKHDGTAASTLPWSGSNSALKEQTSCCNHVPTLLFNSGGLR